VPSPRKVFITQESPEGEEQVREGLDDAGLSQEDPDSGGLAQEGLGGVCPTLWTSVVTVNTTTIPLVLQSCQDG
jgi:hypothetical protein